MAGGVAGGWWRGWWLVAWLVVGGEGLVACGVRGLGSRWGHGHLREVEDGVLAEVVGRLDAEDAAVPAVALPRRARAPGVVGPARVIPAGLLLVEVLVLDVAAQVGQHAAVTARERVEVLEALVEKVDDFLKTIDMNYKMAKMPQNLTAAVVQQHRLIPLVNSKTISPLKALAEIAFYYKYDLCPEAHRKIAYDSIVGQQMSAQLIAGNLELRLSAVDVFLDVESSKILLKPTQAENDGVESPFGNEGTLPGAGSGSNPLGTPDAAVGAFPGAM